MSVGTAVQLKCRLVYRPEVAVVSCSVFECQLWRVLEFPDVTHIIVNARLTHIIVNARRGPLCRSDVRRCAGQRSVLLAGLAVNARCGVL